MSSTDNATGNPVAPRAVGLKSVLTFLLDGEDDPALVAAAREMLAEVLRNAIKDGCTQLQQAQGLPDFIKEEMIKQVDTMIEQLQEKFLH